jgi:hypothetical protein
VGASGEGTFFWKYDDWLHGSSGATTSCAMPSDVVVSHEDLAHVQVVLGGSACASRFACVRCRHSSLYLAGSSTEHDECGFSVTKVASRRRRFVMRVRESRESRMVLYVQCACSLSHHVSLMTCSIRMIRGCR